MVMAETLPLADVKARFSELADRVEKQHERIVVTRNGRPAVVLVSPDDLESLEETLSILSSKELTRKVRAGVREIEAGRGIPLTEVARRRSKP
jgi:prevent-host-death family protein